MEYSFFILILLIVIWINLHTKISKSESKTEDLIKEIGMLRKLLESKSSDSKEVELKSREVVKQNIIPQPERETVPEKVYSDTEEYHIPILSVEERESDPKQEILKSVESVDLAEPTGTVEAVKPVEPVRLQRVKKPINYEKYIGENLFGKIGILVLVVGMGLFVKYAIDQDWINEVLRTILGFSVGFGLLLIGGKLKDRYRTFSSLLVGGAFAIFYVTVAMAYHYYGLFSQPVAFILLVLFTGLMSTLSMIYNRRELAIIALLGGFIAPFLVSDGTGSYAVLFTYVMILDLGMFGLSMYRKWGELPVLCFVLTWLVMGGYVYPTDLDLLGITGLTHLLCFSTAFYLIFLLSVASIVRINERRVNQYMLGVIGLNNFIFLFFALWFLNDMGLGRNYNGIITLFVAVVNFILFFWVKRKGEHFTFLLHTLLGIAITFISITIPIQLEGTFITLFWASEMMIILWFYSRFRLGIYKVFAIILPVLTLGSYGLDLIMLCLSTIRLTENQLFVNGVFATGIFTGLSYWIDGWLLRKVNLSGKTPFLVGCVILYVAFVFDLYQYVDPLLLSVSYIELFTVAALFAAIGILGRKFFPVSKGAGWYGFLLGLSLIFFVSVSAWVEGEGTSVEYVILWVSLFLLAAHIYTLGWYYYETFDVRSKKSNGMTIYLCLLATILLAVGTNNLLNQSSLPDELSAGFSISLSIAGFVQMAVGMRKHLKIVRMISLATFSIVLLKLVMVDLWLLPTIGKVVVFIMLGVILLVLSFLYQKLKTALFDNDL